MTAAHQVGEFAGVVTDELARQVFRDLFEVYFDRLLAASDMLGSLADDLSGPGRQQTAAELEQYLSGQRFHDIFVIESLVVQFLNDRVDAKDIFFSMALSSIVRLARRLRTRFRQSADEVLEDLEVIEEAGLPQRPIDFIIACLKLSELAQNYASWWKTELLPLANKRLSSADWLDLSRALEELQKN